MKKSIIIGILISLIIVTSTQAMSNSPPLIILEGKTGEYLNGTIYFSDVPTDTLTGYEKWTLDGEILNRSLKASDLDIELIYPKVVEVKDGKAIINISAKVEKSGNYIGAIFYRTSGQMGMAAGTWIEINVTEDLKDNHQSKIEDIENEETKSLWLWIQQIWRKFWNLIFPTVGASSVFMNTTVNVISAPISQEAVSGGGGGGGGNLQRDTDRDGICDWFEEIRGTDPNNPCDPDSECKACLVLNQKQSVQSVWVNETPVVETKITPAPTPSPTPETPILVAKKPFQWKFLAIPIGIIIAIILFSMWRGREYEDEGEYEYEEDENDEYLY